jgi:hypothetical protein
MRLEEVSLSLLPCLSPPHLPPLSLPQLENERNAYRDAMVLVCDTYAGKEEEYGSWFLY